MKKLVYISILSVMVLFTSCSNDIDNWYTNTAAFDGRFTVAKTCADYDDDNTTIEDGEELMIYNSAANVENEIMIDVHVAGLPVKGKFDVSGTPSEFNATGAVSNLGVTSLKDDGYYAIIQGDYQSASDLDTPEQAGVEYDGVQVYARLSLEVGKIIPDGATTIGGNVSDSVFVQLTTYNDQLVIESYELPQTEWEDPNIPKYEWRVKANSRTNIDGEEEHWTFEGYRYTGFPEDVNPTVPIIEN